jgi:hypothetical protein
MGDSIYRGSFILKSVLLAISAIILVGSYKENHPNHLYSWLLVLFLLVTFEIFMSLFRPLVRIVHTIQILEFVWQCMAISEVWA